MRPAICCKHNRSHGAAGREAGDEYFAAVGSKCRNRVLDHLPDRKRFAVAAHDVARQKPRETILRIVGGLLLRIDDREAESVGERRPSGTVVILGGGLGAAMERDHQRRLARQVFRNVDEHTKVAGICTKPSQFSQPCRAGGGRPGSACRPLSGRRKKTFESASKRLKVSKSLTEIAHRSTPILQSQISLCIAAWQGVKNRAGNFAIEVAYVSQRRPLR